MSDERGNDTPKSWFNRLSNLLSTEPENREELLAIIHSAGKRGVLDAESQQIIESTLRVADMQVREIMVPRAQIMSIRDDSEPKDFLPILIESAHSRFPVLASDNSDEVVGILLAKDLLRLIGQKSDRFDLKDYLRPAFCVPESAHLDRLLREFKEKQTHMAIVVDEYGGIAGLVTLEDALEQIVGDIHDEHDDADEAKMIAAQSDGQFLVDALTPIADFNDQFGADFLDDEYDTIGGFVTDAIGHLPEAGEELTVGRFHFRVGRADQRRVHSFVVSIHGDV